MDDFKVELFQEEDFMTVSIYGINNVIILSTDDNGTVVMMISS